MLNKQLQFAIEIIVEGIVKYSNPERILLFGSAASPTCTNANDLDFLVVVPDSKPPSKIADILNLKIRNKPMPCDFLVATPKMLQKANSDLNSVYTIAMREGHEVYAR